MAAKKYLVRDWMTPDPVIITPDTTLTDAYNLIRRRKIRNLPVVDEGELVGIVSWGDIREARPSELTSVGIFEIYHMLARVTVEKIMSRDVATIGPDDSMGKAARIMHDKRFAALPVVENGKVIGILTSTDIFGLVVEITGNEE
jgi:acetoin utilization protein AcuB